MYDVSRRGLFFYSKIIYGFCLSFDGLSCQCQLNSHLTCETALCVLCIICLAVAVLIDSHSTNTTSFIQRLQLNLCLTHSHLSLLPVFYRIVLFDVGNWEGSLPNGKITKVKFEIQHGPVVPPHGYLTNVSYSVRMNTTTVYDSISTKQASLASPKMLEFLFFQVSSQFILFQYLSHYLVRIEIKLQ